MLWCIYIYIYVIFSYTHIHTPFFSDNYVRKHSDFYSYHRLFFNLCSTHHVFSNSLSAWKNPDIEPWYSTKVFFTYARSSIFDMFHFFCSIPSYTFSYASYHSLDSEPIGWECGGPHTHNPWHTSLMFGEQEAAFTNLPFNLHHAVDGTG